MQVLEGFGIRVDGDVNTLVEDPLRVEPILAQLSPQARHVMLPHHLLNDLQFDWNDVRFDLSDVVVLLIDLIIGIDMRASKLIGLTDRLIHLQTVENGFTHISSIDRLD